MAVYFVTGKLGAGKSLVAVARIKDRLFKGLPVATNLNINLAHMVGRNMRNTRLYRIPDKPSYEDLVFIGVGNKTYDEEKNGLLVLDECGTWFNSRSWADKSRQDVINWFLHARKLGWDIIFLVQDMNIVDKQARLALAEHVVYCRRTDRANIPFIGSLFKLLTASKMPMPKVHLGIVRYGDSPTALKVDTWTTLGPTLYGSYDTKQKFSDFYDCGVYSVLPPWYTHGRYTVPYTFRNVMRITKIYFRKWSRVAAFSIGVISCFAITVFINDEHEFFQEKTAEVADSEPKKTLRQMFDGWKIISYANYPGELASYRFIDSKGDHVSAEVLRQKGINVKSRGSCEALLVQGAEYVSIYCS